MSPNKTT